MSVTASKGEATREAVLRAALAESSRVGLRGITIGGLATATGMSKSGLFAHFGSKEGLQIAVMDYAAAHFTRLVVSPSLREERGEPRVRAFMERWLTWASDSPTSLPGGCIFVAVASEFDDEPDGPVRDTIVGSEQQLLDTLTRIVEGGVTAGHFRSDIDGLAVAHDLLGIILGFQFASRLMRDPAARSRAETAIDRVIERARA